MLQVGHEHQVLLAVQQVVDGGELAGDTDGATDAARLDVEVDAVKHYLVPVGLVQPTGGYGVNVFPLTVSGAADGDVAERGVGVDLDLVGVLRGRARRGHLVAHPAELGRDVQPRGAAFTDTDLDLTHRSFQRE